MKLLRDVMHKSALDTNPYFQCDECGWYYSARSRNLNRIRHNFECSDYNPSGMEE